MNYLNITFRHIASTLLFTWEQKRNQHSLWNCDWNVKCVVMVCHLGVTCSDILPENNDMWYIIISQSFFVWNVDLWNQVMWAANNNNPVLPHILYTIQMCYNKITPFVKYGLRPLLDLDAPAVHNKLSKESFNEAAHALSTWHSWPKDHTTSHQTPSSALGTAQLMQKWKIQSLNCISIHTFYNQINNIVYK